MKAEEGSFKKKKNSKTPEIKVWKMRKEDFLIKDYLEASKEIESNYNFSDYSEDESEVFEDSEENLSDEEFLTPIQFASVFGRKQAALSTSTPNLSRKNSAKRGASSPKDSARQKKQRNKNRNIKNSATEEHL